MSDTLQSRMLCCMPVLLIAAATIVIENHTFYFYTTSSLRLAAALAFRCLCSRGMSLLPAPFSRQCQKDQQVAASISLDECSIPHQASALWPSHTVRLTSSADPSRSESPSSCETICRTGCAFRRAGSAASHASRISALASIPRPRLPVNVVSGMIHSFCVSECI